MALNVTIAILGMLFLTAASIGVHTALRIIAHSKQD